jgi:hypothetical protein
MGGMDIIDMIIDEMGVMHAETTGDHHGRKPLRTKRQSDRENWLPCSKMHRA